MGTNPRPVLVNPPTKIGPPLCCGYADRQVVRVPEQTPSLDKRPQWTGRRRTEWSRSWIQDEVGTVYGCTCSYIRIVSVGLGWAQLRPLVASHSVQINKLWVGGVNHHFKVGATWVRTNHRRIKLGVVCRLVRTRHHGGRSSRGWLPRDSR